MEFHRKLTSILCFLLSSHHRIQFFHNISYFTSQLIKVFFNVPCASWEWKTTLVFLQQSLTVVCLFFYITFINPSSPKITISFLVTIWSFFSFYFVSVIFYLFSTLVTRRKTFLYFFLPSSKFTFFFILFKNMPLSTLLILATCVSYINFLRVAQLAIKSLCCLLVQEHIKSLQITLVNVISLWIFHILVVLHKPR